MHVVSSIRKVKLRVRLPRWASMRSSIRTIVVRGASENNQFKNSKGKDIETQIQLYISQKVLLQIKYDEKFITTMQYTSARDSSTKLPKTHNFAPTWSKLWRIEWNFVHTFLNKLNRIHWSIYDENNKKESLLIFEYVYGQKNYTRW